MVLLRVQLTHPSQVGTARTRQKQPLARGVVGARDAEAVLLLRRLVLQQERLHGNKLSAAVATGNSHAVSLMYKRVCVCVCIAGG